MGGRGCARALDETLLERLVALNHKRAAEEAAFERGEPGGKIRWLRPEFQDPARSAAAKAAPKERQVELDLGDEGIGLPKRKGKTAAKAALATSDKKRLWPVELRVQLGAVADVLANASVPLDEAALAAHFAGRGSWKSRLPQILAVLEDLGRARRVGDSWLGR